MVKKSYERLCRENNIPYEKPKLSWTSFFWLFVFLLGISALVYDITKRLGITDYWLVAELVLFSVIMCLLLASMVERRTQ